MGDPDRVGQILIDEVINHSGVSKTKKAKVLRCLISDLNPEAVKKAELHITHTNGTMLKTIPIAARGEGQTVLEAQALSVGTYVYSLVLDGKVLESKQMILTK